MGDSPAYKAATLFDMGAHASFVNREVAAWVEGQARRNLSYLQKACEGREQCDTTVSLAGTAYCSSILGCVVFDLTFFDEVSRLYETIRNIQAQVIDSCIPVIVSRPIIRANHLVRKIPLYFDEIPRSKPDLSQPVVPVTTPVTASATCRGTQFCDTWLQRYLMLVVGAED